MLKKYIIIKEKVKYTCEKKEKVCFQKKTKYAFGYMHTKIRSRDYNQPDFDWLKNEK